MTRIFVLGLSIVIISCTKVIPRKKWETDYATFSYPGDYKEVKENNPYLGFMTFTMQAFMDVSSVDLTVFCPDTVQKLTLPFISLAHNKAELHPNFKLLHEKAGAALIHDIDYGNINATIALLNESLNYRGSFADSTQRFILYGDKTSFGSMKNLEFITCKYFLDSSVIDFSVYYESKKRKKAVHDFATVLATLKLTQ